MESLETNKLFAAVLLAGIAFVGSGLIGGVLVRPTPLKQTAIKIDVPEAAGAGPSQNTPEVPIAALLASADPARGEATVKAQGCVACHSFNDGGKAGVGPNLWGVVGAPHGHMPGFQYSEALKGKAGPWTFDELNEWLLKPAAYAPGTKMSYAGLADPKKRADVIDYLRTLSDKPEALPAVPAGFSPGGQAPAAGGGAPGGAPAATAAADESIEARLAKADPDKGKADTLKLGCIACHTYNEGGHAGIGPNMWNVVGSTIGEHMQGYTYSSALKAHGGTWTWENLDKWLTKPAAFAPGTKMTFAGVPDPQQRADLIDYLHTLANKPEALPGK